MYVKKLCIWTSSLKQENTLSFHTVKKRNKSRAENAILLIPLLFDLCLLKWITLCPLQRPAAEKQTQLINI